jgi:polyisoprenoid-binding protein YceI
MPRRPQAPDLVPARRRALSPKWIIGGVAVIVLLIVGGTRIYIVFFNGNQPAKLALSTSAASSPATATATTTAAASAAGATGDVSGQWTVGANSVVGYRVKEILFGQSTSAVGRTSDVTGELTVAGTSVTSAKFTADMTTVKSDKSQRDGQFRGRIMDVASNPTATFVETAPIAVPAAALTGAQFTSKATGDLTLHGKTKSVTFDLSGKKSGDVFEVTAQIPIHFADFGIPNPTAGPATVGDDGTLEVLLKLTHKVG